jgi:hypothetical protein
MAVKGRANIKGYNKGSEKGIEEKRETRVLL